MRFTGFTIDGFGVFYDQELRDLSPGLTVLTGPNEAGKSTSLAFFRQMLFGFPTARDREQSYPPLVGGNHGGRLYIASDQLGDLVLQREKGPHGGRVTLTPADGNAGPAFELQHVLGGVTGPVFRNVYAFSLSELQTFETLSEDSVAGVIYAAATGAGALALPAAEKSLERRMAELFAPSAKKPRINRLLAALDETRKQLREAQSELADYARRRERLDDVGATITALEKDSRRTAERSGRLQSICDAWESWVDLVRIREDLQTLPVLPETFPDGGQERFRDAQARLKTTTEALLELEKRRQARGKELALYDIDDRFLECAAEIRDLASRTVACREALNRQAILSQQADAVEHQIDDLVQNLGPGWEEERALAVDPSVFSRDAVRQLASDLRQTGDCHSEAERKHELAQQHMEGASRQVTEARGALSTVTQRLDAFPDNALSPVRSKRDAFAGAIRESTDLRNTAQGEQERLVAALHDIRPGLTLQTAADVVRQRQDLLNAAAAGETELKGITEQSVKIQRNLDIAEARGADAAERAHKLEEQLDGLPLPRVPDSETAYARRHDVRTLRRLAQATEAGAENGQPTSGDPQSQALARFVRIIGCTGLVVALASGVALILSHQIPAATVVLVVVGGAGAIATWRPGRIARLATAPSLPTDQPPPQEGAPADNDHTDCLNDMETLLEKLDLQPDDLNRLDELEDGIAEALEQIRERQALVKHLEEARREASDARVESGVKAEEAQHWDGKAAEQQGKWREHLASVGLPGADVSPANLSGLIDRLAACVEQGRRAKQVSDRFKAAEDTLTHFRELCLVIPPLTAYSDAPEEELLVRVNDCLADYQNDCRRRPDLEKALANAEAVREKRDEAAARAAEERTQAEEATRQTEANWAAWLTRNGLPQGLAPETALDVLITVEAIKQKVGQRDEMTRQLEACRGAIEAFRVAATGQLAQLEISPPELSDLPGAVLHLQERLDKQQGDAARRKELARNLAQIDEDIETAQTRAGSLKTEIDDLFEAAGVDSEDAFLDLATAHTSHTQLRAEERQAEMALRHIMAEPDLQKLEDEFRKIKHGSLAPEVKELTEKSRSLDRELADHRRERADLQAELRRAASADDVSRLRYEEEALSAEIRGLAQEWAALAVTQALLDQAKQHFERNQQPAVLRDATRFFKLFTAGAYNQVIAPLGERSALEVVDQTGRLRKASQLSRGTAEQLYLAIRFGYVRNHAASRDPLPVVMDDILVNFDPVRAEAAAQAVAELSQTHQVLFFTCHPTTADMLCQRVPDSRRVRLEGGTFCDE
ncbi:MAG: AAA family ATPase [Lentisphaerae bacterium]|nr:AAA family ATPase [Lentisphaerota bacterium]MBT5604982.1 AAA family ATPase [Lentisphaerota bacterium]MBT7055408.1 AAA family ATPase [Lentisphaerota bacterium]MBT7847754.1 AAA family ATPase [Lentisphaerota bacterium]